MVRCRCQVLNVLSGDVARDYLNGHLSESRRDGMGHVVHRCDETDVEWLEERTASGYADDIVVLRRLP